MMRILPLAMAMPMTAAFSMAEAAPKDMPGAARQKYEVFVDSEGVMRRSDTGDEVSYYGTNYTAPFAYSYRALKREGHDLKREIDKDIYHIARMGMNAYRLHLWDAELADSLGNLVDSEHLDLLDYMIARLEERGIDILLTAQTNFGNGYPERNIDTGSFTYDYDKCHIHDDPEAQKAQERYLTQLLKHSNPYTGRTLGDDKAIIAWEINNEPCHSGSRREVTAYIDRMSKAMRRAGYKRPILYNVTHNPGVTEAYYDATDIQGTTYQWYPTGLVANHEKRGNFLPALDNYDIPWRDSIPGFDRMARVVYEYDPADVMYSHLYPAAARTFRKEGFQWMTQFAYDPLEIAQYNTEYPTHYLNLVYTPAKALSMMIAAKAAAETPRGKDYGSYPENTKFGHVTISHDPDLSVYNAPEAFIYTNSNDVTPVAPATLRQIAGHGSSKVVKYEGSGAYFLDATSQPGVWRLEVMPDVVRLDDPFAQTSVNDAKIIAGGSRWHMMRLNFPQLGENFDIYTPAGLKLATASDGEFEVASGVVLLANAGVTPDFKALAAQSVAGNIGMGEYVAPEPTRVPVGLLSARRNDPDLIVNQIPEAWNFTFDFRNPSWQEPVYYLWETRPVQEGLSVVRRRVGDKIARLPESVKPEKIDVSLLTYDPEERAKMDAEAGGVSDGELSIAHLPEDRGLAVVTREGVSYSAPVRFEADGRGEVSLKDLKPAEGVIMPAPYPTMLSRKVPAPSEQFSGFDDVEFIELRLPDKPGENRRLYLLEVWAE